ncbi:MAG: DNA polymerase III subunit gamma/tau [Hyphomicrobiales bacterium]
MDGISTTDANDRPAAYRVLARKYRPQTFEDLIGQEAMVRTLKNAFETGRIAQAYMLTGVRGIGKTTTARILARALNYTVPGKIDRPTIDMPELGLNCQAIMESRHVDIIEMDAASHTGIGDIREIIEAVRYRPVSARYKVYIIDEVHMLSGAAFNGLLKTLEEPPEHVKFIFATTEIRKVPVTVLSRCQRFDLRRIEADVLVRHLRRIADAEKVEIDDEALALVARASEGSVRDALSLLDQAIAHGGGRILASDLRGMLGLADHARIVDLFEHVMKGDAPAALAELAELHVVGADPAVVLTDLAQFVHLVTRLKLVPEAAGDAAISEVERVRGRDFASRLSLKVLSRAWQMLLKGIPEVEAAPKPLAAADMVLVRLCYAADLPTPDEALKLLADGGGEGRAPAGGAPSGGGSGGPSASGGPSGSGGFGGAPRAMASARAQPVLASANPSPVRAPKAAAVAEAEVTLARFEDVVALAQQKRELMLKLALERQVRVVSFEPGRLEFSPTADAAPDLAQQLAQKLREWTGRQWFVTVSRQEGGETIAERQAAEQTRLVSDVRADPLVARALERFPGARIVDVVIHQPAAAEGGEGGESDEPLADERGTDDI